jgi:hypothetical protein
MYLSWSFKVKLENIALKHHMKKRSDAGDRYTWMEAKAEKLLHPFSTDMFDVLIWKFSNRKLRKKDQLHVKQ